MALLRNTTHHGGICITLHVDYEDIISFETRQAFEILNYVFLSTLVGLFGIASNSINITVFYKQGFQNTTTISFMGLAISDLCSLLTLMWFNVCMNPLVASSSISFVPLEIHSLTGGWPYISFSRITGWITVYITVERCLCVTMPLTVKRVLTPRKTTGILIFIYFINIITVVPVYATAHIGWKFYQDRNITLLGLIVSSSNDKAEGLVFFLHAVLVFTSFIFVIILTCVLVVKLNGASQWRLQATKGKTKQEYMSKRDKKTTSMVIMISSLLIVFYAPGIVFSLVTFCEPKFGIFGAYKNLFMATWSFGFLFSATNSSVNIFMYYKMSSKYREIFGQIFLNRK